MYKKAITLFPVMFLFGFLSQAQPAVNDLIREGIAYHDQGNYDAAIARYHAALRLAPQSAVAMYEMGYSFYMKNEPDSAMYYCNRSLQYDSPSYLPAVILVGSILDDQGHTKESIKLYKKALKKYDNYLLHFNLAVSYGNYGQPEKALEHAQKAALLNPAHGSSHLSIAELLNGKDRIRSILALYFFLLVEPDSKRSEYALGLLLDQLSKGISMAQDSSINVVIDKSAIKKSAYGINEVLLSLTAAGKYVKDSVDIGGRQWFHAMTEMVFNQLEIPEHADGKEDVWVELYIPVLQGIKDDDLFTYCNLVGQSQYAESKEWVANHVLEVDMFKEKIFGH